jgi:hypothetical protein
LIGQRFDSLDRLARAANVLGADLEGRKRLPEIRNQVIAALGLTDLHLRWQRDYGDFSGINVDAALERCAVTEHSGTVVVRRLDDNREEMRLPGPEQGSFRDGWSESSPDGELLVAVYGLGGGGELLLRVWHVGRRELLGTLRIRGGLDFHPDGRRLTSSRRWGWTGKHCHIRPTPLRATPLVHLRHRGRYGSWAKSSSPRPAAPLNWPR